MLHKIHENGIIVEIFSQAAPKGAQSTLQSLQADNLSSQTHKCDKIS